MNNGKMTLKGSEVATLGVLLVIACTAYAVGGLG
jgi:hypothetical protein